MLFRSPVSWEGNATGVQTTKGGAFKFDTTDLPADCVGTLVIGSESREVVIAGCAHPLKTGQTNPFGVTGSDGDLQKGTARSYTDNLNGTITDDSTGLVWEKLTSDATIHDVGNFYTWADAFAKIAALNTANFAGHSDWQIGRASCRERV